MDLDLSLSLINKIAKQYTDLCIAISYARENIKATIQQFAFIGTNRIIEDTIKDYFLKNFSIRTDWRYISDSNVKFQQTPELSGMFQSLSDLTNTNTLSKNTQFFKVKLIQYYDSTQYLNIYREMPDVIIGYAQETREVLSTYVTSSDEISTLVVPPEGLTTSVFESYGFTYNQEDVISYVNGSIPTLGNIITVNVGTASYPDYVQVPMWNSDVAPSITFRPGAVLSTIIPAGTMVKTWVQEKVQVPVYGSAAELFLNWNDQHWIRDFSYTSADDPKMQEEIAYYELFYDELKMADTAEQKFEIYTREIYPRLVKIYQVFTTSGFAEDIYYLGRNPGVQQTKNHANSAFPTIAPQINFNNLIAENDAHNRALLYLARPYYEPIAYYINLLTQQILKMQSELSNGRGTLIEGWRQTYIEFKGYNSYYEEADNTTKNYLVPNQNLDFDGPFVYSSLQKFIQLYYKNNKQLSWSKCLKYVKENYFESNEQIQNNIATKLFAFQHKIYDKVNFNIVDFQVDDFGNQFMLYKHLDYNNYEDVGQIWVRLKNNQLAVPLMNLTTIQDISEEYKNDQFDTLQIDTHILYANMFKELVNNAIQFAIVKNTLFILGKTSYIMVGNRLQKSIPTTKEQFNVYGGKNNHSYLKAVAIQYISNKTTNTLKVDLTSLKFFNLNSETQYLENINEFVGFYHNTKKDSLNVILYNRKKHRDYVVSNKIVDQLITINDIWPKLIDTKLPLRIYSYSLHDIENTFDDVSIPKTIFPYINMSKENFLSDTALKQKLKPFENVPEEVTYQSSPITNFIGKNIQGNIQIEYLNLNINIKGILKPFTPQILETNITSQMSSLIIDYIYDSSQTQIFDKYVLLEGSIFSENYHTYEPVQIPIDINTLVINNINIDSDGIIPESYLYYTLDIIPSTYISRAVKNIYYHLFKQSDHLNFKDAFPFKIDTNIMSTLKDAELQDYNNIWRINNNNMQQINIAYESINKDLTTQDQYVYNNLLISNELNYYVGVLKYVCDLNYKMIDNTSADDKLYTTTISKIQASYNYEPIFITNPQNILELKLLQSRYPRCILNSDTNKLTVQTLVTTLGGIKTEYELEPDIDVLKILSSTISTVPEGLITVQFDTTGFNDDNLVRTPKALANKFLQNYLPNVNGITIDKFRLKQQTIDVCVEKETFQEFNNIVVSADINCNLYPGPFERYSGITGIGTLTGIVSAGYLDQYDQFVKRYFDYFRW